MAKLDLETGIADGFRQSVGSNFSPILLQSAFRSVEFLLIWYKIVADRWGLKGGRQDGKRKNYFGSATFRSLGCSFKLVYLQGLQALLISFPIINHKKAPLLLLWPTKRYHGKFEYCTIDT